MRHCAGCHNHPESTLYDKGYRFDNSGKYAMCFQEIINQFAAPDNSEKIKGLQKLLENNGGFDSYTFGSSIIFRAILTVIVIFNILNILMKN